MSQSKFFLQLLGVSAFSVAIVFLLNLHDDMHMAQALSWSSIAFYILLSIAVFYAGSYMAKQKNKHAFTSIVFFVMLIKMLLCVVLVAIFAKSYQPTSNFFLIPFFLIYVIYTVFEVYLMTRLGKQ